jgi:hypothetical protein
MFKSTSGMPTQRTPPAPEHRAVPATQTNTAARGTHEVDVPGVRALLAAPDAAIGQSKRCPDARSFRTDCFENVAPTWFAARLWARFRAGCANLPHPACAERPQAAKAVIRAIETMQTAWMKKNPKRMPTTVLVGTNPTCVVV